MSVPTLILTSLVLIRFILIPRSARAANIRVATPVWVRMPTPTTESLARVGFHRNVGNARACGPLDRTLGRPLRHREGEQRISVHRHVLDDHIDKYARLADRAEHQCGITGPVRHVKERDPRLRLIEIDSRDDQVFHPQRRGPPSPRRGRLAVRVTSGTSFIARGLSCDGDLGVNVAGVPFS